MWDRVVLRSNSALLPTEPNRAESKQRGSLAWVCLSGLSSYRPAEWHARTPRAVARKWSPVKKVANLSPSTRRNSDLLTTTMPTAEQKLSPMSPSVCSRCSPEAWRTWAVVVVFSQWVHLFFVRRVVNLSSRSKMGCSVLVLSTIVVFDGWWGSILVRRCLRIECVFFCV